MGLDIAHMGGKSLTMRHAVGIDLGGTSAKYAVVASDSSVLFLGSRPTPATLGAPAVLDMLAACVDDCRAYAAAEGIALEAVGIGTPGIVTPDGQTVVGGAENIAGWENVPLGAGLSARSGLPVTAGNDANMMAMGEWAFGAARGLSDVLFVTVGTGIGSAALIGGNLWRGYLGRGMEMGHITVKCDGEPCACGGRGCLEHYASTSALVRRYEALTGTRADGRLIVARYHEGEHAAVQALDEHWTYLAHGIASMINVFAPQRVVVGGGISESGPFYFERLRQLVDAQAMDVCSEGVEIVPAELGNRAGTLGSAALALRSCSAR